MAKPLNIIDVMSKFQYKPNFFFEVTNYSRIVEPVTEYQIHFKMFVEDSTKKFDPWELKRAQPEYITIDDSERYLGAPWPLMAPSRAVVEVGMTLVVPPYEEHDLEAFLGWLRFQIGRMEEHETDEWFRYDGKLCNDPHKEKI